ncbi:hypothetical protein [Methylobacterium mesophilicum]|uniref:hypothetical protein n=1 Tax=Methylobacterium mesophilicum TaxID=39956 RepID=UPI002F357EFF
MERDNLSQGAVLILQMAYASAARTICSDPFAFQTLGLGLDAEEAAREELEGLAILDPGKFGGEILPTKEGWALIGRLWPNGQIPGPGGRHVVVGSFDGEEDLPVRLAVPVPEFTDVLPSDSPFVRETLDQGAGCSAWQLLWPTTGEPTSRIIVRVERGVHDGAETTGRSARSCRTFANPGRWFSVDLSGETREARASLEQLLFLIAMGAG